MQRFLRSGSCILTVLSVVGLSAAARPADAQVTVDSYIFTNIGTKTSDQYVGPAGPANEAIQIMYSLSNNYYIKQVVITTSNHTVFNTSVTPTFAVAAGGGTTSLAPSGGTLNTTTLTVNYPLTGNGNAGNGAFFQPRNGTSSNSEIVQLRIDSNTLSGNGTPELLGPVVTGFGGNNVDAKELVTTANGGNAGVVTPAGISVLFSTLDGSSTFTLAGNYSSVNATEPNGGAPAASYAIAHLVQVPLPGGFQLVFAGLGTGGLALLRNRRRTRKSAA